MKNLGKGLLVVLVGFGMVTTLGLSGFFLEGVNTKDFDASEEKKEDLPKKDKDKIIPATFDINPDKLNLKSKGKWITAYIELPIKYDLNDIVFDQILLNGLISPEVSHCKIGDNDNNDIPDLMVKFDRDAVKSYFEGTETCEITITGKLVDGNKFEGIVELELLHF
jgi:hypothetical protein